MTDIAHFPRPGQNYPYNYKSFCQNLIHCICSLTRAIYSTCIKKKRCHRRASHMLHSFTLHSVKLVQGQSLNRTSQKCHSAKSKLTKLPQHQKMYGKWNQSMALDSFKRPICLTFQGQFSAAHLRRPLSGSGRVAVLI